MTGFTTAAAWVQLILSGAEQLGLDIRAVQQEAGLSADQLKQAESRVTQEQVSRLWQALGARYERDDLPLAIGSRVRIEHVPVLGYALLSSASLEEAFGRLLRFQSLIGEAVSLTAEKTADEVSLIFEERQSLTRYTTETAVVAIVGMVRWLTGQELRPLSVFLTHAKPEAIDGYREFMGCEVMFGAPQTRITFTAETLSLTVPSGNERLAEMHDELAQQAMAELKRNAGRELQVLKQKAVQSLMAGRPDREWMADTLGISISSLQRRLRACGTSFRDLMEEVRKEQSVMMLKQGMPLAEIADRLGYREQSNFQRAFRRWFGTTPKQYSAPDGQSD